MAEKRGAGRAWRRRPATGCSLSTISGCRNCSETGFKGRIAVYEVMELREELKEFVLNGASALELKREAMRLGMKTLRQSAFEMMGQGVTTLGEVLRVSTADN